MLNQPIGDNHIPYFQFGMDSPGNTNKYQIGNVKPGDQTGNRSGRGNFTPSGKNQHSFNAVDGSGIICSSAEGNLFNIRHQMKDAVNFLVHGTHDAYYSFAHMVDVNS